MMSNDNIYSVRYGNKNRITFLPTLKNVFFSFKIISKNFNRNNIPGANCRPKV